MSQVTALVARRSSSPSPDRTHAGRERSRSVRSAAGRQEAALASGMHLLVPSFDHGEQGRRHSMTDSSATPFITPLPLSGAGLSADAVPSSDTIPSSSANAGNTSEDSSSRSPRQPAYTTAEVEKIRRRLKYHFMTPKEKWKAKRAFPYKLLIQILKILIVTLQLVSYGSERTSFVDFIKRSTLAMCHMYMKDWDPTYETNPYPAAIGQYALYEAGDLYSHVNHALAKYNSTREITLGNMDFQSSHFGQKSHNMKLCKEFFVVGEVSPFNESYVLNPTLTKDCIVVEPVLVPANSTHAEHEAYDVARFLRSRNHSLSFHSLHRMTLEFGLKIIRVKEAADLDPFDDPICLSVTGTITYDNSGHNGQVPVQLAMTDYQDLGCQGATVLVEETSGASGLILGLDALSLLVCVVSLYLCSRSLVKAVKLLKVATRFFEEHFQRKLSWGDKFEFVSLWFIMIVISDILLTIGTCLKIYIKIQGTHSYTTCGLILGLSNLLVWIGILRYLGFFKGYNTLLLTIKKAAPDMLRFLVCALVIYSSFLFCGWIVLGPYHVKFATISTTSECLFSLINGDDMFSTFSIIGYDKAPLEVWLFSRAYIYLFSASYIYLVLSLFIAVIMDAYETIKYCFVNGFPKSFMQEFIDTCPDTPASPQYLADDASEGGKCSLLRQCILKVATACTNSCRQRCADSARVSARCDASQPIIHDTDEACVCCRSAQHSASRECCSCSPVTCSSINCSLPVCTARTTNTDDDVQPVIV